jgi:hypothetical protein
MIETISAPSAIASETTAVAICQLVPAAPLPQACQHGLKEREVDAVLTGARDGREERFSVYRSR